MSGNRYPQFVKNAVGQLRKEGKTYAEIRKLYPIPKSTLSVWLGEKYADVFDRTAQLEHLKKIRALSASMLRSEKTARDATYAARGKEAAQPLPYRNIVFQRSLLSMLYWAEGKKGGNTLVFANTDPRLMLLYLTLLRNCFPIDESRLRARIHVHAYHDKQETLSYWSKLLKIPMSQFGKLYVKKRSKTKKFRENFRGICFVIYGNTSLLKETLAFGEAVCEKITSR